MQKTNVLTYKWNLINKTNKQAKYNQRDWNKEQTDSNKKGRGKGSSRTPGQNQRGVGLRVGDGDGWGENETTVLEQQHKKSVEPKINKD